MKIPELKNKTSEMKIQRMCLTEDVTEEKANNLEDKSIEIVPTE